MSENTKPTIDIESKYYPPTEAQNADRSASEGAIPKVAICTLTNKGGIPLTNNLLASLIKSEMMSKEFIYIFCTDNYSAEYYRRKKYVNSIRVNHVNCEEEHSDFSTPNFRNVTRNKLPSIKNLLEKDINVIYIDNDIYVNKAFHIDMLNIWYGGNEDESTHKLMFQDDSPGTPYCTGLIGITPDQSNIKLLDQAIETNNREIEAGNLHWGDQMSFIKALMDNEDLVIDTQCTALPGEFFPNGYRLKNGQYDKDNFRVAHANYVSGMDEKIKLLKSCNCWIDNAEEIIDKCK